MKNDNTEQKNVAASVDAKHQEYLDSLPTVGQMVLYRHPGSAYSKTDPGYNVPAIITGVNDDGSVNLQVCVTAAETSVKPGPEKGQFSKA